MTDSAAPSALPPAWPMYRAVVGIGILCALAIVVVYELTRPVIARNRTEMLESAIGQVLPGTTSHLTFRLAEDGHFEPAPAGAEEDEVIHAAYDDDGNLIGLALVARGMGYQDVMRLLYSYSFETEAILGIRVLESRETPGLGSRIESDPEFQRNFGELDVRVTPDGSQLAHPIEFVKPGQKTAPWQIDGISGATVTSKATADMLRESSARWIPLVRSRQADFVNRKGGK